MKTLYLDPFSGIAGDMLIGALLDVGLDFQQWQQELNQLNLTGYQLVYEQKKQSAIAGVQFQVKLENAHIDTGLTLQEQLTDGAEHHEHGQHHHHPHQVQHHHGRNLKEIKQILVQSHLSDDIKIKAQQIFTEIAQAEASVHGMDIAAVHFHEVGAIDSIVDIVGALIGIKLLGIDRITSGPLTDGTGTINVAHGMMPVPVPAVMQMRAGSKIPYQQRLDVTTELVTPTGFALVKALVSDFGAMPSDQILLGVGYGFGSRETGALNALRVALFDSKMSQQNVQHTNDTIIEMHTNIDDSTGETLGSILDELLDIGVYDAYYTPIFMKKQRPAYELTVLLDRSKQGAVTNLLFKQTSTVGVRFHEMERTMMQRTNKTINTPDGPVRLKNFSYQNIQKQTLESDDVNHFAKAQQISRQMAEQKLWQSISDKQQ